ncbi:alpha/beta hydrolase (plasmid) [Streptomyces sp. NBC_00536]|uniref:alpha/beta fold hydrolase n=1 Tax=Streptomyces sp. NBC_00536 TaxID=2975769 RepID=UPI002E80CA1E|nr:alpha/beta hydrolase [Streptomyces sp. NBC_00536]WUC84302.1 alpha/beta hydrolase [Streptomyces sp. NBC_00536]
MTEFLKTDGGQLAYDVTGEGPLVVLANGMGDNRGSYGELAALLAGAGYRVARTDLRGHGESDAGWASYTRTDVAGDLLALVRHLGGGPAVLVGHSFAGGAATIAAADEPGLVSAVVEISPFTRVQKTDLGALVTQGHHRKGILLLMGACALRSVGLWKRYLRHAHPEMPAAALDARIGSLEADLRRPGRMAVVSAMGMSAPTDAGARLDGVRCPALIVEGTLDPDWADPRAEGEGIVAELPAGVGRLAMIEGAGHYAHAQFPAETAAAILDFLGSTGSLGFPKDGARG